MDPYDGENTPPEAEHAEPIQPAEPVEPMQPAAPAEPVEPVEPAQPAAVGAERRPRIEIDLIQGDAVIRGGAPQVLLSSPGVRAEDHIVSDLEGVDGDQEAGGHHRGRTHQRDPVAVDFSSRGPC